MLYKDFIIQEAKSAVSGKEGGLEPLVAFAKYVIERASPIPDRLRVCDGDKKIVPLMEKLKQAKDTSERETIMISLAGLLDELINSDQFWYVIPYDKFYISQDDDNEIFFNWLGQEEFCATDHMKIPKNIKTNYQNILIRKLNSGIIKPDMLSPRLTIEAFLQFLLKISYLQMPLNSNLSLFDFLKVGLTRLNMKPEEKYFILDSVQNPDRFTSCRDIVENIFAAQNNSIFNLAEAKDMVWEFGFHSVHGRNKKSAQNEDIYDVFSTEDRESLFLMIADGVSTADLGSGKIISNRILEFVQDTQKDLKAFMESVAALPTEEWLSKCQAKIIDIMKEMNRECVEELNLRISKTTSKMPLSEQQYMSSTLIIGFVNRNRVICAYIGDSDIFYINDKTIMRLNEEHNNMTERIADYIRVPQNVPFQPMPDDSHLTRVMPKAEYCENKKSYISGNIQEDITFVNFHVRETDTIILATDGLIDSVSNTKNDIEKEGDVLNVYRQAIKENISAKDLARQMVCKADGISGIDDITIILLRGSSKLPTNPKLFSDNNNLETPTKFKKLS